MKLVRYGAKGHEVPGVIGSDGVLRDLSMLLPDITGATLSNRTLDALRLIDVDHLPKVEGAVRYGVPLAGISKIVCIGLNYADHAAESGAPIPKEPIIFLKALGSLNGPNDPVTIPRGSLKTDWEVELAVIIGETARYVEEADAYHHVAGYAVANDVSERDYQLERGGTWDKGKGCDTFSPIGPWLVTRDEVPDPNTLHLWLEVNGVMKQNSSTAQLIFKVPTLISYVSQFMTLEPGDVILTGTPPGVGLGQKPSPWYLKPGDVVRLGIEGLSEQSQTFVEWQR